MKHTPQIIPDLWEISSLPVLAGYSLGGKPAGELIRECWHQAHDLKKQNEELVEALMEARDFMNSARIDTSYSFEFAAKLGKAKGIVKVALDNAFSARAALSKVGGEK